MRVSVSDVLRVSGHTLYYTLMLLTLPLAFDTSLQCGLSYSMTLILVSAILTSLKYFLQLRDNYKLQFILNLQFILLPPLLTYFILNQWHGNVLTNGYFVFLQWATPLFTLIEGFSSLLLIQSAGELFSWLISYKSDSWIIVSLLLSSLINTGAFYFLYRIYTFPFKIDLLSASLLGSVLTLTLLISLIGIVSSRGSIIESSLLFGYIVKCIYETFPILSLNATDALTTLFNEATQKFKQTMLNETGWGFINERGFNTFWGVDFVRAIILKILNFLSPVFAVLSPLKLEVIKVLSPLKLEILTFLSPILSPLKSKTVNLIAFVSHGFNLPFFSPVKLALLKISTYLPLDYSKISLSSISSSISNFSVPFSQIIPFLAANLPSSFKSIYEFLITAIHTLTIPLIVSLSYRIGVFYAATKIIPSLYHNAPSSQRSLQVNLQNLRSKSVSNLDLKSPQSDSNLRFNDLMGSRSKSVSTNGLSNLGSSSNLRPSNSNSSLNLKSSKSNSSSNLKLKLNSGKSKRDNWKNNTIMKLIYAYSPCIIIAVYTHLMLRYSGDLGDNWKINWWNDLEFVIHPIEFWNWVNMGITLVLYGLELSGNRDASFTNNWNVD